MKQGLKLFEKAVSALSIHRHNNHLYFSGLVSAEMRKKVQYNVKLLLCTDTGMSTTCVL